MTKEEFIEECRKGVWASKVVSGYFTSIDEEKLKKEMGTLYSKLDQEGSLDETSSQFIEALSYVQRRFISIQDQASHLFGRYRENLLKPQRKVE